MKLRRVESFDEVTSLSKLRVLKVTIWGDEYIPKYVELKMNLVEFDICIGGSYEPRLYGPYKTKFHDRHRHISIRLYVMISHLPEWFRDEIMKKAEMLSYSWCERLIDIFVEKSHDIEAVDPDYYKNLKWMLENDVSDIPDLTFSMDADEEKHILYEKNQVTDYELKPGGRNIRVTEETKHEYVDLVADHILTNAIRPQINSFLEGFNELVPRELIWIFNDKELELLISGLPEIDLDDLKANTEYTGYTVASSVVQWFWEVVKSFNKEDMARLLQFVTGTSKVPLEGFKALQGISGPQRFQIHKAYGAPDRLPSAHTCFNQLDLPEYTSKDQLHERLMLAIHEGSEGFGFG